MKPARRVIAVGYTHRGKAPIFQGQAISLLFGFVSSTFFTVPVISAIYIVLRKDGGLRNSEPGPSNARRSCAEASRPDVNYDLKEF